MKESISVFFPLYNEEGNLERLVARALEVLPGLGVDFEVILVDDGSRDQTAAIADRMAASDPRVRAVHHPVNGGYGAALRSGFAAARNPLVFFADGDNQFDLGEIGLLIDRIDGADVVSGYRIQRQDPWYRRLNSWLYNRAARVLFDIPVSDVNCAFKLYRRPILERVLPQLQSTGALINVEMLARARSHQAVVREVGVHHYPRAAGTPTGAKLSVIARAFAELFQLWRTMR